ncbi:hypothetical protein NFI96_004264 [Prochilodus magdalenae]|nr:hypothetical protein NFI96_004264 [Prochilodus magdalenae]
MEEKKQEGKKETSSRGFGQSNSLPSAGCVGSAVSSRRNLRQFPVPSRSLPVQRLGLLGTAGLLGHTHTPRSSSSTPTSLKQGRQVYGSVRSYGSTSSGYNPSLQGILLGTVPGKASTKSGPPDQFYDVGVSEH